MFVRKALIACLLLVQAPVAFGEQIGSIILPGSQRVTLAFAKDVRKETKIATPNATLTIGEFPVFVSLPNKADWVPRFRETFFTNMTGTTFQKHPDPQAFVVFKNKVYLFNEGHSFDFELPVSVESSTDIKAAHSKEGDLIALRAGNRTTGFVVTKDDLQMFDLSLAPRDIESMSYIAATNKVLVNNRPYDLATFPVSKMKNPRPIPVAPKAKSEPDPEHENREANIKAAFELDARKRAADAKSGTVDLHDHNNILMSTVFDATTGDLYKDKEDKMVDLPTYLRENFTFIEKVQRNEIDQIAFEKEIALATTGLLMAQGGSVRVTGSPGVGKSHFQDTLLAGIFTGKTSPALTNRLYLKVSAAQLGGGTKYVGTFEEKVRALKTLSQHVPVVLMIDEIHSLVGQGTHKGNNNDFFQYIKEELATGRIKIIGMTTTNEWEKHMSVDQALANRFSIHIKLEEPTPEKLASILENFKKTRHPDSRLNLSLEQLTVIAQLATRFDPIDANPRKSIRLLDFVVAKSQKDGATSITNATLISDASLLYNYDIGALTPDKIRTRILELNQHLNSKLIGLEDAKSSVIRSAADYFVTQKSNVNAKPYGLVLYGDAGAGKTELAKQTAAGLGFKFNRLMMGDYATASSAEDFKTKLALTVKANPFQVLLLDEIEKAHPAVQAVLLRVMDEGRLSAKLSPYETTESELDASKLFIFAATNAARELPGHEHSKSMFREVAEHDGFNRYLLDRFSVYIGLPRAPVQNVREIMKLKAKEMLKQLHESGYQITANLDQLADHLLKRVRPTLVSVEPHAEPIGFVVARDVSNPAVQVRFSVRELEAELQDLKRSISTHIVMHDAHSIDLQFDKHGDLKFSAGAPQCRDLFARH